MEVRTLRSALGEIWGFRTGRIAVITTMVFAIAGLLLTVLIGIAFTEALHKRDQYRERLRSINARTDLSPEASAAFAVSDKRTISILAQRYLDVVDSLGFGQQVRGYVLRYDLRPVPADV
jgi:hypothetical protein